MPRGTKVQFDVLHHSSSFSESDEVDAGIRSPIASMKSMVGTDDQDTKTAIKNAIKKYRRSGTMGVISEKNLEEVETLDIPPWLKHNFLAMFNAGYTGETYYDFDNRGDVHDPITIIHFNDVYNVDGGVDGSGGFAKFMSAIRTFSDRHPLIFFSGDAFNPSMMSTMMRGRQMIPFLNSIKITSACVGNHDWDFGIDDFEILSGTTNFPWLLSNCVERSSGRQIGGTRQYHIFEHQGHTVGVIGLIEYEWLETISLLNIDDVKYTDFVKSARSLVQLLRFKGCGLIIALTHMRAANDEILAREVSGIDLLLGGHDHHYAGFYKFGDTIAGKSGTDFREFSLLEIFPGDKVANPEDYLDGEPGCLNERPGEANTVAEDALEESILPLSNFENGSTLEWRRIDCSTYAPNVHIERILKRFTTTIEGSMSKELGKFSVDLEMRFSHVRTQETNWGSFVTNMMRFYTKCDIAILNSGTLRADINFPAFEPFTLKTLCLAMPFPDKLAVVEISGKTLIETLECGYSQYPKLEGRFLQISGIRCSINPSQPPGSRVSDVLVKRWTDDEYKPVEEEGKYSMVTKMYLLEGKDGFDCLLNLKQLVDEDSVSILPTMLSNQFEYLSYLNGLKSPLTKGTAQMVAKLKTLNDLDLGRKGFSRVDGTYYMNAITRGRISFVE